MMLGPTAEFRDGQWDAIDLAANRRQRVLVVQRTGWGKSVVYFLTARILRDAGAGPALLISPLLSLMRNQLLAATKLGLRAVTIHSENLDEWPEVAKALRKNAADLLMISPERLGNAGFQEKLLPLIQSGIGLFVVDEAHCISDWGHDFRPDYRRILRVLKLLPQGVPVLCTTATANDRVVKDVESQIDHLRVLRGPLVRPSLRLFNIRMDSQSERLAWLAHNLPKLPGSGIVYTLTVQNSRRVATYLHQRGITAREYNADLEAADRIAAENQLLNNEVKALVATVALGMGFDKPDLGFVIHFQRPGSVVAYYQQVGRAGRAVDSAFGILLNGTEDDEIQNYFIRTAFPAVEIIESVLQVLKRGRGGKGMTIDEISGELNHSRNTIEKALKLLEVDGAVTRNESRFARTGSRWDPLLMRAEQVTAHRRAELQQMKSYVEHKGCLMEFLSKALDDPGAASCGKCMNCTGKTSRQPVPIELKQAAVDFLRADHLVLEPRERWPGPLIPELNKTMPELLERYENDRPKTLIPAHLRPEEGRVLCNYGDAGWGLEVSSGKYGAGRFSDALVAASAELILSKWKPQPLPQWITALPSQRHQELMQDFGKRVAARLGMPFVQVLRKRAHTQEQKEMQNSAMQLRNLLGAFQVIATPLQMDPQSVQPAGFKTALAKLAKRLKGDDGSGPRLPDLPVLLVDDVVDSGWTLTMAAVLLRQHGSGPVYPFTLARASLRGS